MALAVLLNAKAIFFSLVATKVIQKLAYTLFIQHSGASHAFHVTSYKNITAIKLESCQLLQIHQRSTVGLPFGP